MKPSLRLRELPGRYAVARLEAGADIPQWVNGPGFSAVIRADDELILVCRQDRVPDGVEAERDWTLMRTVGPFPFEAAGIVHTLITPLSTNGIGIFVVCTFDGEHLLVPARDAQKARDHLTAAGHHFIDP